MSSGEGKKIFISYSSLDKDYVSRLASLLEDEGYQLWVDSASILGGQSFIEQIPVGIQHSDMILFILSRNSDSSRYVGKELIFANNKDKPIVPINIEGPDFSPSENTAFMLGDCQYIMDSNRDLASKDRILRSIAHYLGDPQGEAADKAVEEPAVQSSFISKKILSSVRATYNEKDVRSGIYIDHMHIKPRFSIEDLESFLYKDDPDGMERFEYHLTPEEKASALKLKSMLPLQLFGLDHNQYSGILWNPGSRKELDWMWDALNSVSSISYMFAIGFSEEKICAIKNWLYENILFLTYTFNGKNTITSPTWDYSSYMLEPEDSAIESTHDPWAIRSIITDDKLEKLDGVQAAKLLDSLIDNMPHTFKGCFEQMANLASRTCLSLFFFYDSEIDILKEAHIESTFDLFTAL